VRKSIYFLAEMLASLLLLAAVHALSDHFQARLTANSGRGWDGVWYCQMADQIANRETVSAMAPFGYRVGVPFLAALADMHDIVHGFREVNIAGSYVTAILLVIWFRLTIPRAGLRCVFFLLFLSNWLAPARVVHVYPAYVDIWPYPFVLAVLLLTQALSRKGRTFTLILITLLCAVGVLVRETVALVAFAVPFAYNPLGFTSSGAPTLRWRRIPKRLLLPVACAAMVFISAHIFVHPTGRVRYWSQAMIFFYSKSWLGYCHSWLTAFGPILLIPVYHFREVKRYFSRRQYQAAYIAALIAVTLASSPDIERHVLVALPVIYSLIAHIIDRKSNIWRAPATVGLMVISQALASRVFLSIAPDEGVHPALVLLTPLSNRTPWHDLFPLYAIPRIAATSFWQYVLLGVVLLWFVEFRSADVIRVLRGASLHHGPGLRFPDSAVYDAVTAPQIPGVPAEAPAALRDGTYPPNS